MFLKFNIMDKGETNSFKQFFNLLRKGDPLVIHDEGEKPKSEKIELGIKAVQGHVFVPTLLSAPMLTKGHG